MSATRTQSHVNLPFALPDACQSQSRSQSRTPQPTPVIDTDGTRTVCPLSSRDRTQACSRHWASSASREETALSRCVASASPVTYLPSAPSSLTKSRAESNLNLRHGGSLRGSTSPRLLIDRLTTPLNPPQAPPALPHLSRAIPSEPIPANRPPALPPPVLQIAQPLGPPPSHPGLLSPHGTYTTRNPSFNSNSLPGGWRSIRIPHRLPCTVSLIPDR
jgi:hypothetical protein